MTIPAVVAVLVQARRWLAACCDKKAADLKIARLRPGQHHLSCHHNRHLFFLLCTTNFSPTPFTTSRSLHTPTSHDQLRPLQLLVKSPSRPIQCTPETTTPTPLAPLKPEPKPQKLETNPCCLATLELSRSYCRSKKRAIWSLPLGRTSLIAAIECRSSPSALL